MLHQSLTLYNMVFLYILKYQSTFINRNCHNTKYKYITCLKKTTSNIKPFFKILNLNTTLTRTGSTLKTNPFDQSAGTNIPDNQSYIFNSFTARHSEQICIKQKKKKKTTKSTSNQNNSNMFL